MNDINWSNVTSGVGLAGFSTRVRYLRVLNPILFDYIVPAVTTGPTSAFRRAADGHEWAKPLLTAIWVIFQLSFRPPGRLWDVRRSPIATVPAIQGPSTRQALKAWPGHRFERAWLSPVHRFVRDWPGHHHERALIMPVYSFVRDLPVHRFERAWLSPVNRLERVWLSPVHRLLRDWPGHRFERAWWQCPFGYWP